MTENPRCGLLRVDTGRGHTCREIPAHLTLWRKREEERGWRKRGWGEGERMEGGVYVISELLVLLDNNKDVRSHQ